MELLVDLGREGLLKEREWNEEKREERRGVRKGSRSHEGKGRGRKEDNAGGVQWEQ